MITIKFYSINDPEFTHAVTIKTDLGPSGRIDAATFKMAMLEGHTLPTFRLVANDSRKPKGASAILPEHTVPGAIVREAWRLAAQIVGIE